VGYFAFPESNDGDQGNLDPLSSRRDAGQHPVHSGGMGKLKHHFVNQLIDANGA
jgi:hypothetical protein